MGLRTVCSFTEDTINCTLTAGRGLCELWECSDFWGRLQEASHRFAEESVFAMLLFPFHSLEYVPISLGATINFSKRF